VEAFLGILFKGQVCGVKIGGQAEFQSRSEIPLQQQLVGEPVTFQDGIPVASKPGSENGARLRGKAANEDKEGGYQ
jgi:hypothetical protein